LLPPLDLSKFHFLTDIAPDSGDFFSDWVSLGSGPLGPAMLTRPPRTRAEVPNYSPSVWLSF
jgi:hypothetical protein